MKEYRNKINGFLFRHALALSLVTILISLYFLSIADSGYIGLDLLLTNLKGRMAISIVLISLMVFMGFGQNCFSMKDFLKGFLSGWHIYFRGINTLAIIAIIFDMFCTGLFEEVLMRGVVFQCLNEKWGHDRNGIMKSFFISSVLFGFTHLLNYSPGLLVTTISQIIFTTFIGMFLCSIFICSERNIWVVVALHAIFDFITLILQQEFIYSVVSESQVTDMSVLMGVIIVAATLPLGWLGIMNIHKFFQCPSLRKI